MQQPLHTIEQLMRRYGHVYQANLAQLAIGHWQRDPAAACAALCSDEWWEASDSLAAMDLAIDGGFSAEARQDAATLREALIKVYTTMKAYDQSYPEAELMVSQFRKWNASHV